MRIVAHLAAAGAAYWIAAVLPVTCPAYGATISVSHFIGGRASAGLGSSAVVRPFSDIQSRTVTLATGDHDTNTILTTDLGDTATFNGGVGSGQISSVARARVGSIGVSLNASVSGVGVNPEIGGGAVINPSNVQAGWTDTLLFSTDEVPPGFLVLNTVKLRLSGAVEASAIGGPVGGFRNARAQVSVAIEPTGFVVTSPHPNGSFGFAVDNLDHTETTLLSPPEEITGAISCLNKQPVQRGIKLVVAGQAVATSVLSSAGSVGASFEADLARTLNWGGITGVVNPVTGAPITNYTLTSESGFDYTQPFIIPEPATLAPVILLSFCLARRGGRQR